LKDETLVDGDELDSNFVEAVEDVLPELTHPNLAVVASLESANGVEVCDVDLDSS